MGGGGWDKMMRVQVGRWERLIPPNSVVLECIRKFSVCEVVGWRGTVIQPLEQVAPWEESLIECAHDLRVTGVGFDRGVVGTVPLMSALGTRLSSSALRRQYILLIGRRSRAW